MFGPRPRGFWSTHLHPSDGASHAFLVHGARFRVTRAFVDFDGHDHPVGERWVFLGSSFAPHDDGLSLFVSLDGEQEWQIRMRWADDGQAVVLDRFGDYVSAE